MIIQHKGKLSIKEIVQISDESDVLSNLIGRNCYPTLRFWYVDNPTIDKNDIKQQFYINHMMHGGSIALKFGKPNCNMRGYESYPGAWVFYDIENRVRWLVFSDGIRKGCFKGTSYELTIPEDFQEDQFKQAIKKFFTHFGCFPLNENS